MQRWYVFGNDWDGQFAADFGTEAEARAYVNEQMAGRRVGHNGFDGLRVIKGRELALEAVEKVTEWEFGEG